MVRTSIAAAAFAVAAITAGQASGIDRAAQPSAAQEEMERLKSQAASLRQELATAKLELRKALRELQEIRDFLASDDPQAQAAQWRQERQDLAEERRRLEVERRRLEEERRKVQRAIVANEPPPTPEPSPHDPALGPNPQLDYKLAYVRTVAQERTTYIEFGDLLVPADTTPNVDRNHVMVRGTIQNRSRAPWRYTFEVRLADRAGNLLGRRRYQTPLLGPNELHPFDIDVPVTDALRIDRYQIGNIEADQAQGEGPRDR
jgi:hypothetical protein